MNYQRLIEESIILISELSQTIETIENDENYFRTMPTSKALMVAHHKLSIKDQIEDIKYMQAMVYRSENVHTK